MGDQGIRGKIRPTATAFEEAGSKGQREVLHRTNDDGAGVSVVAPLRWTGGEVVGGKHDENVPRDKMGDNNNNKQEEKKKD